MRAMNRNMWATKDGHRYTSIPTDIPEVWVREKDEDGYITYTSGEYVIERTDSRGWPPEYGFGGRPQFSVYRQTVSIGMMFGKLKDAKAHAVKNARGEDVVSVA